MTRDKGGVSYKDAHDNAGVAARTGASPSPKVQADPVRVEANRRELTTWNRLFNDCQRKYPNADDKTCRMIAEGELKARKR